ncbi:MAG TPA: helix-turn-helix domain-containing protein [Chryseosolibacter sp.]|nr:helix-turn-helix domain-containing protein [Chryseosolibacter sp.]
MRSCYLILILGIIQTSFSETSGAEKLTVNSRDTAQIQSLIRASKALQWIDPYKSLDYADSALNLARDIGHQQGMAMANNLRGFSYWSFGDNDLAIASAMDALAIAEKENNIALQSESYYILARGYMDLNERARANQYIVRAEQLAEKSQNGELQCSIYNLKGVIMFIEHKPDSALHYYTLAHETGKKRGVAALHFPRIISNIGECYAKEDPAKAFRYFNEALALAKETSNRITEASITAIIGHALLQRNDIERAESHLQSALVLARELGLRRTIRYAYAGLVDIEVTQGRGDQAVKYLRRYYAVRDSLLNSSKIRQIVELEAKHAAAIKEQHMQILEKEARITTLWNNLLVVLVIFITILSGSIYALQRYRFRKNREMLNLEIDYLTQQQKQTTDRYKVWLTDQAGETLESHDQKLLKQAIAVVEVNMNDPQFGVEMMAAEMNMSRTNLHRKIKSITGFPPSELIRSIRLRRAGKLIINKVDTISQIALLVGFEDYAHFSKAFKKHFGVSPSGYETQHAKQTVELDS